jgi:uncharacterized OsmC-like protein
MTADELRRLQAPIKERYRAEPDSARATLRASGTLDVPRLVCRVESEQGALIEAGLHPMAAGDGAFVCAGNMLLEALAGCAGVTLSAVATAIGIDIAAGRLTVEGDMDFRGTLGVNREVPVGFTAIRIRAELETNAEQQLLDKLAQLTERYCVVAQSLKGPLSITISRPSEQGRV